jgi:tetratricopeptide (TPR) repeat protein
MSLSIVLHPDVVSFLGDNLNSEITGNVWGCIEKMREQQFDQGLRAKKLKGVSEKVWEARINKASRLIFTYKKSIQPDTGKPQTYIAVQDICLDHDDISRRARARKVVPDSQWLDADVLEMFGNLDSETISTVEQTLLKQMQSEDIHIGDDFYDELLGNIQWKVVDSEEEWRQAIIEGGKDLSLKLTQQEYELATKYGNFLVMGSAGTGKTTVGLYRMVNSLTQLGEGKRLYVAASPILVKESEKCFNRLYGKNSLGGVFEFKTIKQLCFDILHDLNSDCNYLPECEVTYHVFEKWYYGEYSRYDRTVYPSTLVWHEIRGIIKGASLDLGNDYLSEFKYRDLGKKRSSVIAKKSDRDDIYKIAKRYKHFLEDKQLFDEIDLTRKALGVAFANPRYQMIVCDEVQDFAELQLLLLIKLIASGGQLFFTGDLNQMILPSAFRWEDLTSILAKENINYNKPEELNTNFRSVGSLSNLSNQILKLRCDLLREQSSKGFASVSGDFRDAARNINTSPEEISSILKDLYPDEAILVRTIEEKEKFNHLKFVFTIEEAKGLEFDTVFLVEFFTPKQNLWTKLLNQQKTSSNENVELRLEFNLLYVAITRARRVLNIWESQKAALWSREEVKPFVQSITPESARQDRIEPTQQDWLNRGIYYRDAGFYTQAIECFEKAGEVKLRWETNIMLLLQDKDYVSAQNVLMKYFDSSDEPELFHKLWQSIENIKHNVNSTSISDGTKSFVSKESKDRKYKNTEIQENTEQVLSYIEVLANSGADAFLEGDYEKAIEICNKVIKLNPRDANSYNVLGIAKSSLGDFNGAITSFTKAISLSPRNKMIYLNYVSLLHKLGSFGTAIYYLTKAIEINPHDASDYFLRGHCYFNIGNTKKSIEDFNIAIYISPEIIKEFGDTASAKFYLGEYTESIIERDKQIISDPKNAKLYYYRGLAKFRLDKNEDAMYDFNTSIKLDPRLIGAYYDRGLTRSRLGDIDNAIEDFNIAISLNSDYTNAYANRGTLFIEQGNYRQAVKDFNKVIDLNYHDPRVYNNRGNAKLNLRDYNGALDDYNKAIKLDAEFADAYVNRAVVRLHNRDSNGAISDCNKAIQIDPQRSVAYINRAAAKKELGDHEGAKIDEAMGMSLTKDN